MNDKTNEAQRSRASSSNDETNAAKRSRASFTNRKTVIVLVVVTALLAAAGLWYLLAKRGAGPVETATTERKPLYWHDPMVPGYRSDKPGKSPFMDMQLVPVYEGEAGNVVSVRPEIVSSLGVRTYKVERAARARRLAVSGYVQREDREALVLADVFERGADWLRAGLPAEVRVETVPGRSFEARVESVQPDIGVGARSWRVVLRLDRPDAAIKSNMLAEVLIQSPPAGRQLAVPREALIRTGTRTAMVLALGAGRFQPVEVVPGAELGDWIEIVKGLNEGDTVVISGQFLIDSEASVRASFARMEPTAPAASPAGEHQH
ncbi:MAG: efflux RND transporter periplasmic adaptor subunit [Pseudomonadota bacterium]